MSTLPEITRLFALLASDLRRSNTGAGAGANVGEIAGAVSALTRSLNPDDECQPRVRVLDAALSLMCFKSPEVCRARIESTVQTIVAVLTSLASCKVIRLSGGCGELLQVGNSVSYEDCNELIQACADLVESLEGHGESSANSHDVVPMRLTLWCLDPLILKHDISEILWEKVRRPFLRLKDELHDKLAWRSMIICLVASPTTFAETRALLHSWFLMT
ncbi:hypothetical protein J5N97_025630 [Dioscorea zingiberensis]|uniref:Uncharacterized protein n=1 Tax=Dioscorea zingiberensis TaxID=325984 RepID=A0A9D5C0N3_9LILI|nr:hypothetical protein J5N97_025630 [Dioscorea zingiberensis]